MWIKALYPDFSYCALFLLISADGQIKWKNIKKPRPLVTLSALESFILEWNVDGSSLGKPGPAGIGGVLSDHNRMVLGLFSIPAGVKDSNEAELLAIVKAPELSSPGEDMFGRNILTPLMWLIGCLNHLIDRGTIMNSSFWLLNSLQLWVLFFSFTPGWRQII